MSKRTKRQNYIFKDPINIFALVVVFLCFMLKAVFLNHFCEFFGLSLYFSCVYIVILLAIPFILAFYSVSLKAVSSRKEKGQIRNGFQWAKVSSVTAFVFGILFLVVFIFCIRPIGQITDMNALGNMMFIFLAIGIPFLFFNSSAIGSFKGLGMSLPFQSVIILFSITEIIIGFIFSAMIGKSGNVNSALFHNDYINVAFYGAGMSVGFMIANILSTVWLIVLLRIFYNSIKNGTTEAYGKNSESVRALAQSFISSISLPVLKNYLFILPYLICVFFIFFFSNKVDYADEIHPIRILGKIIIQFIILFFIPMYFSKKLSMHSEDLLKKSMARRDRYHGGMRLLSCLKQYICFVAPVLYFVSFTSQDFIENIIGSSVEINVFLTMLLFTGISLSGLFQSFLNGFAKETYKLIAVVIGLIGEIIYLFLVLKNDISETHIMISFIVYFGVSCIVEFIFVYKYFVYKKQLLRHIGFPLIALIVFCLLTFLLLMLKNSINIFIVIPITFVIAFLVHSTILVMSGAVKEHELPEYPQNAILNILGKAIGIF